MAAALRLYLSTPTLATSSHPADCIASQPQPPPAPKATHPMQYFYDLWGAGIVWDHACLYKELKL